MKAILVGVQYDNMGYDLDISIEELKSLAYACDIEVKDIVIQNLSKITPQYYIGSGKVRKIYLYNLAINIISAQHRDLGHSYDGAIVCGGVEEGVEQTIQLLGHNNECICTLTAAGHHRHHANAETDAQQQGHNSFCHNCFSLSDYSYAAGVTVTVPSVTVTTILAGSSPVASQVIPS